MDKALISWSDAFLVNNETIDTQHKELVSMTNSFYAACQKDGGPTKADFLKTIQGAVNYAKTHFSSEEEIMLRAAYPDFASHQKEHRDFTVHIIEQVRLFENNEAHDPRSLVKMLGDWIREHIAVSDKKYAPYIAEPATPLKA